MLGAFLFAQLWFVIIVCSSDKTARDKRKGRDRAIRELQGPGSREDSDMEKHPEPERSQKHNYGQLPPARPQVSPSTIQSSGMTAANVVSRGGMPPAALGPPSVTQHQNPHSRPPRGAFYQNDGPPPARQNIGPPLMQQAQRR